MKVVAVNLDGCGYRIHIGESVSARAGEMIAACGLGPKCLLVTNPTVGRLYLKPVLQCLAAAGMNCRAVEVPDGEKYKNLGQIRRIYDAALSWPADRQTAVLALGGGVVGDMAGFAAATILRGLPLVQIPTTLLAQVDSSIGGKVGVNHPRGKNLIGAFHQPRLVISDLSTLKTLPGRELRAGLTELVKHGMIKDAAFFSYLDENLDRIVAADNAALEKAVAWSCRIKAAVVERDEKEAGERALLNYGHTVGHALESYFRYGYFRHGEAVALGIAAAARIAMRMGILSAGEGEKQLRMVRKLLAGLPVPAYNPLRVWDLMQGDKKARQGRIRMVFTVKIGEAIITDDIDKDLVMNVLGEGLI
ncbi:MAG: 3-dehydroquinate synthase [Bacillota bacterium]